MLANSHGSLTSQYAAPEQLTGGVIAVTTTSKRFFCSVQGGRSGCSPVLPTCSSISIRGNASWPGFQCNHRNSACELLFFSFPADLFFLPDCRLSRISRALRFHDALCSKEHVELIPSVTVNCKPLIDKGEALGGRVYTRQTWSCANVSRDRYC